MEHMTAENTVGATFPDGFLWGSSTAGHQVEGGNVNADIWPLEWDKPSLFVEPSGDACDHYHRYPEDIATLAELGLNAYRFSLEWSRIEPAKGEWSRAALDNYRLVYERDLKLRPPFTIEFGATGLKGQHLLVPSVEFPSGELAGPIRRDSISRQYQLGSFDSGEWMAALRDFLIEFYDLAARERDKVLTQRHVEANQLPPL